MNLEWGRGCSSPKKEFSHEISPILEFALHSPARIWSLPGMMMHIIIFLRIAPSTVKQRDRAYDVRPRAVRKREISLAFGRLLVLRLELFGLIESAAEGCMAAVDSTKLR